MLNQGNIRLFILIVCLYGCSQTSKSNLSREELFKEKMIHLLGTEKNYLDLYNAMSDTVSNWYSNNLLADTALYSEESGKILNWYSNEFPPTNENISFKESISTHKIDSTYVLNSKKNKLIGIIYQVENADVEIWSDQMREFLGAKIDGQWYFWMGASTPIIRESLKNHDPTKPLPYSYLHQMGVGSLSGYLDKDGNIRDEWFEAKFKNPGWGYFKDRYEYKYKLDGQRIDNEKEYWEYLWKRKGLGNWITKSYKDSIALREQLEGKPLADEEKREISMACSRKMMNSNFPLYKGKYKD